MRKITLLMLFLSTLWGYSQVKGYSFSQTSGTYTAVTGGLLLSPTNPVNADAQKYHTLATLTGSTSVTGAGLDIGFPFVYNGVTYQKCGVHTDGWIALGTTDLGVDMNATYILNGVVQPVLNSTMAFTNEVLATKIAPFGRDLVGQAGCNIRYETSGTAPDRVLTVQWSKFKRVGTFGTGDSFDFQVKLYETSNKIEFIYGTMTAGSTVKDIVVGLRAEPSAVASNFANRKSATDWNATDRGLTASDNILIGGSLQAPVSGLKFTWTPPTCGSAKNLVVSAITDNSATLNWDYYTPAPSGYEYVVTTATAFPTGSGTGTTTGTASVTDLVPNTGYNVFVRSACGTDFSQWTLEGSFRTKCIEQPQITENFDSYTAGTALTPVLPYCWEKAGTGDAWIKSGSDFPGTAPNSLFMESIGSATAPTVAYVILPKVSNLKAGTQRLKFKAYAAAAGGKLDVGYLTDRNNASTFVLLETVSLPSTTVSAALDFSITPKSELIPDGINSLVFRNQGGLAGTNTFYIDDVIWGPIPACADVKSLIVDGILSTSANVKWTKTGTETAWQYAYGPTTLKDPSTLTPVDVSDNTQTTITGLSPVTSYRVWVRAKCDDGSFGAWIIPVDFTTTCTPGTGFFQNFDASTSFPACWKKLSVTGSAVPTSTTGAPSGNNTLKMDSTTGITIVAMEPVSTSGAGTYRLKFRLRGSVAGATVQVGYLTNIYDPNSFNFVQSFAASSATLYDQINTTLGSAPTTPYLAFRVLDTPASIVYIDDVIWEPTPSCPDVTAVSIYKVASTSADLNWITSGTEGDWQFVAGPATTTNPSTLTATDFAADPYVSGTNVSGTVTGLTPSTAYKIWLRSKCSSSDLGVWIGPLSLTTTCAPVTDFAQYFDVNTSLPSCWTKVGTGTVSVFALTGTPSTPNVLSIVGGTTTKGIVALPPVSNSAAGTYRLRFKYRGSVANAVLEVGYLMNLGDPTSFNPVGKTFIAPSTTVFTEDVADLGLEPASQVLAFRNPGTSGSIYIDDVYWEPIPYCPAVSALKTTLVTGNSIDLTWTPGGTETNWQYALGASTVVNPNTLTPVTVTASSITVSGLMPTTSYKVWVRSKCGLSPGIWTDPISFTTSCAPVTEFTQNFNQSIALPSCWTSVDAGGSIAVTALEGQGVLSISGSTSQGIVAMQPVSNIAAGNHRLRFKLRGAADANVSLGYLANISDPNSFVFIEAFTPTSEIVFDNKKSLIPSDPKMQVLAFKNTGNTTSIIYIDDVIWEAIPDCAAIVNKVAVNGTTTTSTNVSWTTDGNAMEWQYVLGASTETEPNVSTAVNVTSASAIFNDLTPATAYKVWVRAKCGDASFGTWSDSFNFITNCASVTEFTQNFDVNTAIPDCWRAVTSPVVVTVVAKSGGSTPNVLALNSNANVKATVAMPNVTNISEGTHRLKFKFSSSIAAGTLEVGYVTDINDPNTFTALQAYTASSPNVFETQLAVLGTNPVPGSILAFRNPGTAASSVYLDDVVWEAKPTCTDIANVTVNSPTGNSVQLSWDAIGTETAWQYVVAPSTAIDPDALPSTSIIDADVKTLTVGGLTPQTYYKIWVRSNCGNGVYGAWAGSVIFQTPCSSVETITEDFEASLSDCWHKVSTDGSMTVVAGKGSLSTKALELKSQYSNTIVLAAIPSLSTAMIGNYNLKFKYKANYANTKIEIICYKNPISNMSAEASYTVLKSVNVAAANTEYAFNELLPAAETPHLGLKVYNSDNITAAYIDDFVWEVPKATTCAAGITKTPSATCGNYATTISWLPTANAIGYKLTIGTTSGGSDAMNNQDLGGVTYYSFTGKANTTYYFTVKPWNALGDAADCTEYTFTTATDNCYCVNLPSGNDGAGITNVQIGKTNFANGDILYKNYGANPVDMVIGTKANMNVSFNTGNVGYATTVWVDFNDNFELEPSEIVYTGNASNVNPADLDASFTIPATAQLGVHGMRIAAVQHQQYPPNPCYSGPTGVTLDFKVNIVLPISNDEADYAEVLTVGNDFVGNAILGSNVNATGLASVPAPSCGNYNGTDVWYKAVVPASGNITFEVNSVSGGITNTAAAVYSGNLGAFTLVSCDDSSSVTGKGINGDQPKIALTGRTQGEVLYMRVWENGGDAVGPFKVSAYDDVVNPILGMDVFETNNFTFYPNPVKDVLNLSMNQEITNVTVVNLLGQQVINQTINDNEIKIDMSDLSNGAYLVKVISGDQSKTIKVIKQ